MLNRIFGRADGKFYKIGWIPLMYHVTMEGTVFNWEDIISNGLSSCITVAQKVSTDESLILYGILSD